MAARKANLPYSEIVDRLGLTEASLTVTAKGQVMLRKELLAHLVVRPGQSLDVEVLS